MKKVLPTSSPTRPLIQFFALAYSISWLCWLPYYLPLGVPVRVLPYVHLLGSLGPMLAALFLLYRDKGMAGIRQLAGRKQPGRKVAYWLMIALFVPLIWLALLIGFVCIKRVTPIDLSRLFLSGEFSFLSPVAYALSTLFFFGLGEEVGWRGFVLPRLQATYSAFTANAILVLFWAVWHWPLFLNPLGGYIRMEFGAIVGWFFSMLTGGILFAWLFNSSGGNVLACALFHGTMDIVFMIDLNVPQLTTYTGVLITLWGIYIWSVYKANSLSLRPKVSF